MDSEAAITVDGTKLTADQARIVRLALESFADVLENALGFKDDGTALTGKYVTDTAYVRSLIANKTSRPQ